MSRVDVPPKPVAQGGAWRTALRVAGSLLAIAAVAGAVGAWRTARNLARPADDRAVVRGQPAWPAPTLAAPEVARVFAATHAPGQPGDGAAPQRFRLAGTFLVDDGASPSRRAILDDREQGRQRLVSEGDTLGDLRVVRIRPDRVHVILGGRDLELPLSPLETAAATRADDPEDAAETAAEEPVGEPTRFGHRVEENRWVLERDRLVDYYREMLDAPERVARLYRSFVPVRDEDGAIDGYRLAIRGEEDFLQDVGLREGDRILAVNALRMTSQSRAEYFLGEFIRGDLSTVILDVERDGETERKIYLMR